MSLVSIAIPARSASEQLLIAVDSILAIDGDVEAVVGLNSGQDADTDDTDRLLSLAADDARLRVVRPNRLLSMTSNFRFTFDRLRGDWQTVVGSDDGVLPTLLPLLAIADEHYPRLSLATFPRAYYFWPGVEERYGQSHVRVESVPALIVDRCTRATLDAVLVGEDDYFALPPLYAGGVIRRSLRERIGLDRLFSSYAPDVSAAVALGQAAGPFLRFRVPAFWVGTSPLSNGLAVSSDLRAGGRLVNDRAREFFTLSDRDGNGLHPELAGLDGARYSIAAGACTSALLDPTMRPRRRAQVLSLGRTAIARVTAVDPDGQSEDRARTAPTRRRFVRAWARRFVTRYESVRRAPSLTAGLRAALTRQPRGPRLLTVIEFPTRMSMSAATTLVEPELAAHVEALAARIARR